jgi:ATP-dependent Lon protease
MDAISTKVVEQFKGKIVRKDLTALMKRGANVPTYVLEYLLGMYCATDDASAIAVGVEKIKKILSENYVHPEESEKIKSYIREKGEYTVIDKITATLDEYHDCYSGNFTNLDIGSFVLPDEYAINYSKILMGGIWCMVRIAYVYSETTAQGNKSRQRKRSNPMDSPFKIISLKPIQMPNLNVHDIISKRKYFTTNEWITLMLRSSGIEPLQFNDKEQLHFLERLVPFVERNYNLCELGPRGTGKSHIYKELSPYSILMSGGHTTTSNLFYNLQAHRIGLVGHWDCVAFDEVAGMRFKDMDAIQIMKDYMASGSFARGREQINADASMVFVGNINDTVENTMKINHLFDPFPDEFHNDSAFFDRIHYYLPGWEVPKIRASFLTEEYALITDCLAEFCREMRKKDLTHCFDKWYHLNHNVTTRDEIAIRKTVSGLVKLLYPDDSYTEEDLHIILTYAIEGRRRVKEQLRKMAGEEFADVDLGYITNNGKETIVYVPEQSDATLIASDKLPEGHVYSVGRSLSDGMTAVYRLENKCVRGTAKLELQGVLGWGAKAVKEAINASWFYFLNNAQRVFRNDRIADKDYLVYYGDLQSRSISTEVSIAELIGLCSAATETSVMASLAVVGELTLSGTINEIKGIQDYARTAVNAGARYILLPASCKAAFDGISDSDLKVITPLYYSSPMEAVRIALEIEE